MATAAVECITPVTYENNRLFLKNPFFENHQQNFQQNGAIVAKQMIGDALRSRVENIDHESCDPGDEDTFFVGDLGEVYRQHMRWKKNLPRVRPFYGMSLFTFFFSHANHHMCLITNCSI